MLLLLLLLLLLQLRLNALAGRLLLLRFLGARVCHPCLLLLLPLWRRGRRRTCLLAAPGDESCQPFQPGWREARARRRAHLQG